MKMANLQWIIDNNWIGDSKHLYSEMAGRDIGTPVTVDIMLKRNQELKYTYTYI